MNQFYEMVKKGKEAVMKNPRKCDICGVTETLHNVMLKYDNGLIMCDDCAINYYEEDCTEDEIECYENTNQITEVMRNE